MNYVDVHAHMDFPDFKKDLKEVLERGEKQGLRAVIANGVNKESNRKVLELAKKYSLIKPALGIYPTDSQEMSFEEIDEEIEFIKSKDVLAFGEVGMDFKYTSPSDVENIKKQKYAFQKFIKTSEKTKKPLIIHTRQAEQEIIEMLESSKLKNPVLHCFSGKKNLMKRASDNGYKFSVPVILQKSQQFQELVEYVPMKQLLTETDSPYLDLKRTQRNEPINVKHTVKKMAQIKRFDEEETANMIFMNYKKIFKA